MKNRSRNDITAAILESAKLGALKTHIMFDARLSVAQINDYLPTLQKSRLLSYNKSTKHYVTTEMGVQFLDHNAIMSTMLSTGGS